MRRKGFFPALLTAVFLIFILYSIPNIFDGSSDSVLDLVGEQGIRLHAPLRRVRCSITQDSNEPGLYVCSNFAGSEGLMTIRLFSLDERHIHAIELSMDPSRFSMRALLREIKEDYPDYNLLFEEDSLVLFVSDTGEAKGPTYLVLKRDTSSELAGEELVLVLMTEEARSSFENAPVQE